MSESGWFDAVIINDDDAHHDAAAELLELIQRERELRSTANPVIYATLLSAGRVS